MAAGVGAGLKGLGNEFAGNFTRRLITGTVYQAIANKGKVDFAGVAADAFGNAVGDEIVLAVRVSGAPEVVKNNEVAFETYKGLVRNGYQEKDAVVGALLTAAGQVARQQASFPGLANDLQKLGNPGFEQFSTEIDLSQIPSNQQPAARNLLALLNRNEELAKQYKGYENIPVDEQKSVLQNLTGIIENNPGIVSAYGGEGRENYADASGFLRAGGIVTDANIDHLAANFAKAHTIYAPFVGAGAIVGLYDRIVETGEGLLALANLPNQLIRAALYQTTNISIFKDDFDNVQNLFRSVGDFVQSDAFKHPIDGLANAATDRYNKLIGAVNDGKYYEYGKLLGQTAFDVISLVGGVTGLVKAGASAARFLAGKVRALTARFAGDLLRAEFRNLRPKGGGSFFDIEGPGPRGEAIENAIGKNTPRSFKTIDRLDPNGEVVSIKSKDLTYPSFLKENGLRNSVRADIRALEDFKGSTLEGFTISKGDIQSKTLGNLCKSHRITPSCVKSETRPGGN